MDHQTKERQELDEKVLPPGDMLPINVEPFGIDDEAPEDVEIRDMVKGPCNGRAGGADTSQAHGIVAMGSNCRRRVQHTGAGGVSDFCQVDPDHMGVMRSPPEDTMDDNCPYA